MSHSYGLLGKIHLISPFTYHVSESYGKTALWETRILIGSLRSEWYHRHNTFEFRMLLPALEGTSNAIQTYKTEFWRVHIIWNNEDILTTFHSEDDHSRKPEEKENVSKSS